MLTRKPQAIAGVSVNYENTIEALHPSIGATSAGRALNGLYECLPGFGQVKLSYLLFIPVTIPLALLLYGAQKILGNRYVVTNRSIKVMSSLGQSVRSACALEEISGVEVSPKSRLSFFRSGDLRLVNATGDTLLQLRGVPYPDRFRQVILEARDARTSVEASLRTIQNRRGSGRAR